MELIANMKAGEARAALKHNGRVTEFFFESAMDDTAAGDIYKGRVVDVLPGMDAAFIDIGKGKKGYLHRDNIMSYRLLKEPLAEKKQRGIKDFIKKGEYLFVQVVKEETASKGAKLKENLSLPGKYCVYLPDEPGLFISQKAEAAVKEEWLEQEKALPLNGDGLIVRTEGTVQSLDVIKKEVSQLQSLWQDMVLRGEELSSPGKVSQEEHFLTKCLAYAPLEYVKRVAVDTREAIETAKTQFSGWEPEKRPEFVLFERPENIFSKENVEVDLERALKPVAWLKSGGFLQIEKTEMCTTIDVNTGRFTGKHDLGHTIVKTNLEAAGEVMHQLRVRNLSGMIMIDFIRMDDEKDRQHLMQVLEEKAAEDPQKIRIAGFSRLGVVEVTRQRSRQSLEEHLLEPFGTEYGKGWRLSEKELVERSKRTLGAWVEEDVDAIVLEVPDRLLVREGRALYDDLQQIAPGRLFIVSEPKEQEVVVRYAGSLEVAEQRNQALKAQMKQRGIDFRF
ncbi:Rne/Rng family ribonuclease [Marinococcus luteus]|uniref:Rne/Rng family ribonuclease n=1 Tax=Marinococcus luteus TaxID=1122204 RepID=UPI002ACD1C6C|nr:Rne/Rng family ribonuclease [Marinococcus luteus]MDZ5783713.1 Rne/Rng family ribonuclease [Marinococcus luteus]